MVRMKYTWTVLFTILVAKTAQAWDKRGGAISANSGQMDYICDPEKPTWDAIFVLTGEYDNCNRLVLDIAEMSEDTTLQIYDGSSLDQSRTCGRIITSSSPAADISVQGSMATLVLRKQSCTYDEPKFALSWTCQVNDTATDGPSYEAGSFVNYGQGMMTWSDLGHPKRHTTAIVADTQVCLKVMSEFGPPNNAYPCESSSLTVHQIGEDGCLTRIHVVCSQTSYFHSESILANLLVVAQFDPSYALHNSDSYQVQWTEGSCQQDCHTTAPIYSTTTTYTTANPTTTEYYTSPTASTETSTSYSVTSTTAPDSTTKYTTPSPSTEYTIPSTTTKYTTPSPTTEYTTPTTSTEYTTPTTSTEYITPTTTTEYTTPTTTTEYTTPTTSTEYTTPTTSTEYTTPTTSTEYTTPTTSTEYTTPTTSAEYTTPTTSTEYTTPTTSTEYTTPTTTTEYTTPTTSTEYTTPTTSTEYTTPTTSTEYTTPTTSTEYTTPTTSTEYTTQTTSTEYTTPSTTITSEYTEPSSTKEYSTASTSTELPLSTSPEYSTSTESTTKSTPTTTTTIPTTTTSTTTENPTITVTDCGGKISIPKGYSGIIDYKSGTNYLNNERCAWLVDSTAPSCTVTFEQQHFESVYDGCVIVEYDKSKPDLECKKYTTAEYSTPQEVSGLFIVSFTSDYSVTRLGFKISINCSNEYQTPGSDDDYNVYTYHSNAPEGHLSYPDTGLNYPAMARFLSVIQSAPALPTRWFSYGEVYMEDHYDCVETLVLGTYGLADPCTRWHRLCGYYPQGYYPANSTTDSLVTWAWSDYSVEKPGFTFNWDLQSPLGELKPVPQDKLFHRNRVEQAYEVNKALKFV